MMLLIHPRKGISHYASIIVKNHFFSHTNKNFTG